MRALEYLRDKELVDEETEEDILHAYSIDEKKVYKAICTKS